MSNKNNKIHIYLRQPNYPTIIISKEKLMSAYNFNELAKCCINANKNENEKYVYAIDANGEEYWYLTEEKIISPGFTMKKWTKKNIISVHNKLTNKDKKYSEKSISSKRLEKIISDICDLNKS